MFYPVMNGGSMTTLQSGEEKSHYLQSVLLKLNKNLLAMKITRVCKLEAIKLVNSCMNRLKASVFKKH